MNLNSIQELNEHVQQESEFLNRLLDEIRKVIVGQDVLVRGSS